MWSILQIGIVINVEGVEKPLFWMLPAGMVIPICAAPLWLTPRHFILGTIAFYLAGLPFVMAVPFTHDDYVLCAMWVAIGIPTATTFHFGFYWFRLNHFLLEEKLRALAATDPLTQLLNRRAFLEQAEQMLSETKGHDEVVSAIFLDIDRFKSLNDQYGHARGDEALMDVTKVLNDAVPAHAVVGTAGRRRVRGPYQGARSGSRDRARRHAAHPRCIDPPARWFSHRQLRRSASPAERDRHRTARPRR